MTVAALKQALSWHQQGRVEEAIAAYERLISDSDCAEPLQLLGIAYGQLGQQEQAKHYLQRYLEKVPDNASAHNNLANVYKKLGEHDSAWQHYQKSLALAPDNASTYSNLAVMSMQRQEDSQALAYFAQALHLKEDYSDAYYNRALLYLKQAQGDRAVEDLKQCLTYDPTHQNAWRQLAMIYHQQGEHDLAKMSYEKLIALDPQDGAAQHRYAGLLVDAGDIDQAIDHYHLALDVDMDDIDTHYNLASIFLNQKKYDMALGHWLKCYGQEESADYGYHVGLCYLCLNRFLEAITYFEEVLIKDHRHSDAQTNLAICCLKSHQYERALQAFKQAQKLNPEDDTVNYMIAALSGSHQQYQRAPAQYVQDLFDFYSENYDEHMLKALDFSTPEHLFHMFSEVSQPPYDLMLDLGCGSGLMGQWFKPMAQRLVGIDLSEKMIALAEKTGHYDTLVHGDLFTEISVYQGVDVVLLCDTLPYLGDLQPLFSALPAVLKDEGMVLFSHELCSGDSYQLLPSGRFQHSKAHVEQALAAHGFEVIASRQETLRREKGKAVQGGCYLIRKVSAEQRAENQQDV